MDEALIKKHWLKIVSRYTFKKYMQGKLKEGGWISQFDEPNYLRYLENHNELFESKTFKLGEYGFDFHIRPLSLSTINPHN